MKIIKLLIAVSITAAVTTFGYQLISNDQQNESTKAVEKIVNQNDIQNRHILKREEGKKTYLTSNENTTDTTTTHIEENRYQQEETQREAKGYSRLAPPPPLTANQSKDARHKQTQGHGHEHAPVSRTRKINESAPPVGANN